MSSAYIHWSTLASDRRNSEDRADVFGRGDDLVVVVADDADLWTALFKEVDLKLGARMAGETTGVVTVVGPKGVTGVSVGDSEAWIVTARSVDDLTRSQEGDRLGTRRAVPASFHRPSLDGVLLIATDGLFKYAAPARIAATVREEEVSRVAERLAALVQLPSGGFQDDVGIVVVARR